MTTRRSFLRLLGLLPIAAPALARGVGSPTPVSLPDPLDARLLALFAEMRVDDEQRQRLIDSLDELDARRADPPRYTPRTRLTWVKRPGLRYWYDVHECRQDSFSVVSITQRRTRHGQMVVSPPDQHTWYEVYEMDFDRGRSGGEVKTLVPHTAVPLP